MTDSPSEETSENAPEAPVEADAAPTEPTNGDSGPGADEEYAAAMAETVGADSSTVQFGTVKLYVGRDQWVAAAEAAKSAGLEFFSWLSAVDWSKEPVVGESVADVDGLEERYEVMCRLSNLVDRHGVILSTSVGKDDAALPSLSNVYGGADWHERETAEMFGIDFTGHPNLAKLYLPDAFEGFPLRKSYPLLSREVKPWPGTVDVEGMPSTENAEAGAMAGDTAADADAAVGGDSE